MLHTFKSDATADVIMYAEHAARLLKIIGKDNQLDKGIVTVEQLPGAIEAIEAAIAEEKEQQDEARREHEAQGVDPDKVKTNTQIQLSQRAWPLLDMMRTSLAEKKPVVWGV